MRANSSFKYHIELEKIIDLNKTSDERDFDPLSMEKSELQKKNYLTDRIGFVKILERNLYKKIKEVIMEEEWLIEEMEFGQILEWLIEDETEEVAGDPFDDEKINYRLYQCYDDLIYYLERLSRSTNHFFKGYFEKLLRQRTDRFRKIID